MTQSESESLEELLASSGWDVYVKHVQAEWGDHGTKFRDQMRAALNLNDNNAAASQARQVWSGQEVILGLMRWPAERLRQLQHKKALADEMDERRPPMPMVLTGERRGA